MITPATEATVTRLLKSGAVVYIRPMQSDLIDKPMGPGIHWQCLIEERIAGQWKQWRHVSTDINEAVTTAAKERHARSTKAPQGSSARPKRAVRKRNPDQTAKPSGRTRSVKVSRKGRQ